MKTNDQDIEKMAREYSESQDYYVDHDGDTWQKGLIVSIYGEAEDAYFDGFKACEAKMLAEASEGFEEWYYDNVADGYRENYLEAFTSGAMSQAKEIQKLKADREVLVEALKLIEGVVRVTKCGDHLKSHETAIAKEALKSIGELG